ncbi:MAG TPA: hypothetical protein VHX88_09035, partial [Solirubrobacteraceae bacterium]|nr:hypothetical protein [Solirubrobacteraceae bacterium]
MRATRGLMGALGAGGSLIAAAAVSLLLISAVFAQQGWPGLGSTLSPVELVAGVQHPHPGTKATPPRVATLRLSEHSVAPPAALHGAVGPRTIGATTHPSHTAPATPPALPPHHHVVSVTPTPPVSPPATTTPSSSAGGSPPASSTTQHSALGSAVSV